MFPTINWTSAALGDLSVALYVALAVLVTVDVLLKKSDVRAALGWIAAAWLSPIFGSLLYYLFGINRVTRRALKLKRREYLGLILIPRSWPCPRIPNWR